MVSKLVITREDRKEAFGCVSDTENDGRLSRDKTCRSK